MGGMGVIHSNNDNFIYQANHTMTFNLLAASAKASVKTFFYASSACVYPVNLQGQRDDRDIALREQDVYSGPGPAPQHLYGLEKLNSEHLLQQFSDRMNILIGRFHNVYGPRGSWDDGHEKVPAAFIRKSLACKYLGELGERATFEIWGDGTQRRSFLFIDDAVQAVAALINTREAKPPLNIGSDQSISVLDLAQLSLKIVGLDPSNVDFAFIDRPVGVASRNSHNELVSKHLSWSPQVSHRGGLCRTRDWIDQQIQKTLSGLDPACRREYLSSLLSSRVVDLSTENLIKFAILLPITSRPNPDKCLENLTKFARSLITTTWRDRHALCTTRFEPCIYLVIDDDDDFLLPTDKSDGRAESALRAHGLSNITTILSTHEKGKVCALWRDAARGAFKNNCDYYVLMGDDIELLDEGWMRTIHSKFQQVSKESGCPNGFGCVAFTDLTFPGMPTFPVIHRTHMTIFDGEVIPEAFINQDGDPYLFQLYRHFGASTTVPCRLQNSIGGSDDARYEKRHYSNWTFEPLESGKSRVKEWAARHAPSVQAKLSLDIIVPSYRVDLERLSKILSLKSSPSCTTMFIVIIDDPKSSAAYQLEHIYGSRMDVRIRVNKSNQGASASRNRGLTESSAEWVAFLDDDVDPSPNYLIEAERYIRERPDAAGFIGPSYFPVAHNIFTTAVHLAGVTYFWDIANKITEDIPWGVTASLIVRRNIRDDVKFDLIFPKTGGGEDIDFCRQKRQASLERGGTAFWAAPNVSIVHPWWNGGRRSYWRFYMWSKGDGALIKMYPDLSWQDSTPNSAELLLLSGIIVLLGALIQNSFAICLGVSLVISTFVANLFQDAYRHLIRDKDRTKSINTTIGPLAWVIAVFEGGLIRMASEMGRLVGILERGEWASVGKRFDWFAGGPWGITEERKNGIERFVLVIGLCAVVLCFM